MAAFVDIHSHILWGLDDGPAERNVSLEMLKIAAASGTTDIVATPHSDLRYSFDPAAIEARIRELNESAGPKLRVHTGCDFHLHFENITDCLERPAKYTINHLRYLLVEFGEINIPRSINDIFDRMLTAGITPVVTHPERNALLMKDIPRLVNWIDLGCALQVTGQSFLGRFGKSAAKAADDLMQRNMVHFVASDGHDTVHRPPNLAPAYDAVTQRYGADIAKLLFEINPKAALTGGLIDIGSPQAAAPKRKWFFF